MGKVYPTADHERELLLDEFDLVSTNLLVERRGSKGEPPEVIAAVRETLADAGSSDLHDAMGCPAALLQAIPASRLSCTTRLVVSRPYRAHADVLPPLLLAIYCVGAARGDWVNWIHARLRLSPMFERLGFRRFGDPFWCGPSQSRHQGFVLLMDDLENFLRLKSPYVHACQAHFVNGPRIEPARALGSVQGHLQAGGGV